MLQADILILKKLSLTLLLVTSLRPVKEFGSDGKGKELFCIYWLLPPLHH